MSLSDEILAHPGAIEQVEQAAARLLPWLEASLNSDGPRHRIGPP